MNAIAFLLGLLVLAYLGSILVGGRTIRGFGLASGAEYLVLGFVLGPQVLVGRRPLAGRIVSAGGAGRRQLARPRARGELPARRRAPRALCRTSRSACLVSALVSACVSATVFFGASLFLALPAL